MKAPLLSLLLIFSLLLLPPRSEAGIIEFVGNAIRFVGGGIKAVKNHKAARPAGEGKSISAATEEGERPAVNAPQKNLDLYIEFIGNLSSEAKKLKAALESSDIVWANNTAVIPGEVQEKLAPEIATASSVDGVRVSLTVPESLKTSSRSSGVVPDAKNSETIGSREGQALEEVELRNSTNVNISYVLNGKVFSIGSGEVLLHNDSEYFMQFDDGSSGEGSLSVKRVYLAGSAYEFFPVNLNTLGIRRLRD